MCPGFTSLAVINYSDEKATCEKGFTLALNSKVQALTAGKSQQLGTLHAQSGAGRNEWTLAFLANFLHPTQTQRTVPTVGGVFFHQLTQQRQSPSMRVSSKWVQILSSWQWKLPIKTWQLILSDSNHVYALFFFLIFWSCIRRKQVSHPRQLGCYTNIK